MKFTLETTQHDIDTAKTLSVMDCVMGRALQRAFPGKQTSIGTWSTTIDGNVYEVPGEITAYINAWIHKRSNVKPTKFELEIQGTELILVSGDTKHASS